MKKDKIAIKSILLLCATFVLTVAGSCASVQTMATDEVPETTLVGEGEEGTQSVRSQEHLQAMLMDYSDTFATKFGTITTVFLDQYSGPGRVQVARNRFYTLTSAFDIASGRYPNIGVINMVVLVTLTRTVWEEYWQPNVYGDAADGVLEELRKSEKRIWTLARRVLTPEQSKELRRMIREWRMKHPHIVHVSFIRVNRILQDLGTESVFEKEMEPGGLFAPVKEATKAVDEIRGISERALYLGNRIQAMANMWVEMAFLDIVDEQEVQQLLGDISGFRRAVEQLPAQISEERKNLIRDLGGQEKTVRNVVGDVRQLMREGNNLISVVNGTTKMVDTITARVDALIKEPPSGHPFDIKDYYNTVLAVSDAVKHGDLFLDSLAELLASPDWEQRVPVVLKITDGVASEGRGLITHAVFMGAALIVFFCVVFFPALLGYRYAAKKLVA